MFAAIYISGPALRTNEHTDSPAVPNYVSHLTRFSHSGAYLLDPAILFGDEALTKILNKEPANEQNSLALFICHHHFSHVAASLVLLDDLWPLFVRVVCTTPAELSGRSVNYIGALLSLDGDLGVVLIR